jgi:hypothetical protein
MPIISFTRSLQRGAQLLCREDVRLSAVASEITYVLAEGVELHPVPAVNVRRSALGREALAPSVIMPIIEVLRNS